MTGGQAGRASGLLRPGLGTKSRDYKQDGGETEFSSKRTQSFAFIMHRTIPRDSAFDGRLLGDFIVVNEKRNDFSVINLESRVRNNMLLTF